MVRTKTEKLARELWAIGIAARRKAEGWNDGTTQDQHIEHHPTQYIGWLAIARYVEKNFVRRKRGKS